MSAPADSDASTRDPVRELGIVDAAPPLDGAPLGPPPVERACDRDTDCAVAQVDVTGDSVCCASCPTTPGNKHWFAELQRFCGAHPAWANPKCGPLACPAGPSVAICRAHRCEATWTGADGGPKHVFDERRCLPSRVCDAWSGCALVAGSTQNGYFVRAHDHVARGELATLIRACGGDGGCVDATQLVPHSLVCGPPPSATPTPPGYTCRLLPGDHEAPEGHCVGGR